jgi:hypothetical protein
MKLLWIQVPEQGRANRLEEMLESSGIAADVGRSVRGTPEVMIRKPRLRRLEPFMDDLESIVNHWLEEDPTDEENVVVRTIDEVFELPNPRARSAGVEHDVRLRRAS